jgi:hypothetical protein
MSAINSCPAAVSLLFLAVSHADIYETQALISHKEVSPNAININGKTALHVLQSLVCSRKRVH